MTKSELKSVIKECMLEILAEGLGNSLNEVAQKKRQVAQLTEKKEMAQAAAQQRRRVADSVAMVTRDPVMQGIFEHTAKTTLQDQLANDIRAPSVTSIPGVPDDMMPPSAATNAGPGIDISSIFAGAGNVWEAAAFAPSKKIPR